MLGQKLSGPSPTLSICCLGLQYQVALQIICCQRNDEFQNTSVFEIAFQKRQCLSKIKHGGVGLYRSKNPIGL